MRKKYRDKVDDDGEEGIVLTEIGGRGAGNDGSDDESVGLTTGGDGVASFSMADTDIHQSSGRRKHLSSSRCRCCQPNKRCLAFVVFSASIAALITYLAQDADRFGLGTLTDWLGIIHHPEFVLESSDGVTEYGANLLVYRHIKTDAKLAALVPKNPIPGDDKVFGIGFRTKPTSSNGVAHILEH